MARLGEKAVIQLLVIHHSFCCFLDYENEYDDDGSEIHSENAFHQRIEPK